MSDKGEKDREAARPFLARLASDPRGNVLAIVGASLVPLLAMLGSGVDLSRAYMAQARLQQACDAAVLAGRRVMSGGVVDRTVTDEATKFFNFNFPQKTWNTAEFTPSITQGPDAAVVISASTTLNTEIMRLFGFTTLPISVTCNAKQDFVNTDIVLVLDTTGSMDQDVNGNDVGGGSTSKIVALRKAVLALYDELLPVQTKLEAAGLRLRYGIVPFSSGINMGAAITSVNPNYIINNNYTYQSRVGTGYQHSENNKTQAYCDSKNGTRTTSWFGSTTCTYIDDNPNNGTYVWSYKPVSLDVSGYVRTLSGGSVSTPAQSAPSSQTWMPPSSTPVTSSWAGCIEERQTTSSITASSSYTIPAAAYDLNINLIPTSDPATKWAPYWPEVEYRADGAKYDARQSSSRPQVACPAPARRLQPWSRSALSTYVDSLKSDGGTYHDNGMIWGARLISQGGIFAGDNPQTYGNMPVSRQIIYMTDGIIDTGPTLYSTYGMEQWNQRVTGTWTNDDDQTARHNQRFKMMCAATKQMGVSIWVIAFASELTDSLSECATSAAQASISKDSAQLTAKFVEIGKSIGALRLTQ